MLFLGMGKIGPFVFYELLCLSPCLFIDSLFIYLLDSIYVFLDLCNSFFRGCCEARTCREGVCS